MALRRKLEQIREDQVAITREVTAWYLRSYFATKAELGLLPMFCDPERVGAFAADPEKLRRGDEAALFRVFIATVMFQRLKDTLVLKILREMPKTAVYELTSQRGLISSAHSSSCENLGSIDLLNEGCNLTKSNGKGICGKGIDFPCRLKAHTEWLKRYGHFGKMPTSAALALSPLGGLGGLYSHVLKAARDPRIRAEMLSQALSRIWRVSDKIAAMFLSALTNRDLGYDLAPWIEGIDSTYFVVIDSNVDLFLSAVGYKGSKTYAARRAFIQELAGEIDLSVLQRNLLSNNPRLVQQAMYSFMGRSNRTANPLDCMHRSGACTACPAYLKKICPVRSTDVEISTS